MDILIGYYMNVSMCIIKQLLYIIRKKKHAEEREVKLDENIQYIAHIEGTKEDILEVKNNTEQNEIENMKK